MRRQALITTFLLLLPTPAFGEGFIDWWLTPDQQGRFYFEREDYQKSARAFEQAEWKANAFYRAGDFANAAALFQRIETPKGHFYLGNSLAKQEKLAPAIVAYKKALTLRPDFPEASFNLEWVEGLLRQDQKEYDDAGGTGGKLGADRAVLDKRGARGKGEMSAQQLQAEKGLTDAQLQEMWMRRVQTTPGDFLKYKFAFQIQNQEASPSKAKGSSP